MAAHPLLVFTATALFLGGLSAQSNLLHNGDAETGDLTGWTDPLGQGFGVNSTYVHGGGFSFHPGISGPAGVWSNELRQDVDLTPLAAAVDSGTLAVRFRGCGRTNENMGWVDAGAVALELRDAAGVVLDAFGSGTFAPYNAWQTFTDERGVPAGTRTLRVRLLGTRQIGASTDCFFDDLELSVYEWQTLGSGCAGPAGVPALALASPPWLGATYGLQAHNLAGGAAFLASGFAPQSLPLMPFGQGFGAGCTLGVVPAVVQFLPQNAGTASWSLGLPADPGLAGLELHSQIVELSAASAVSAVARAGLH